MAADKIFMADRNLPCKQRAAKLWLGQHRLRTVGISTTTAENRRPVRLAYQPPASSTFLSERTSHQQPASSIFLSEQISTSHQPPAKRTGSELQGVVPSSTKLPHL
jgi:hypothetical protein